MFYKDINLDELAKMFHQINKTKLNNGCLVWNGRILAGYGSFNLYGKTMYAHRVAYMIENGVIPKGYYICHKCDNPRCVNHDHLFLGTPTENAHDMIRKNRHNWDKMRQAADKRKKITDFMLIEIKKELIMGISRRFIAKKYNVVKGTIDHIFYRKMSIKQQNIARNKWVIGKNQFSEKSNEC